jgi:glycosyltransferase involved in cell wall biosynthesis
MYILTIHNKYKIRGGEDESRESEDSLLLARGHEVRQIVLDNSVIQVGDGLRVGIKALWNQSLYKRVQSEIKTRRPDVVDVHNFFPLVTPSVYYAARSLGVPVVQTLHNYRLLCPGATFYRNGKVCEDCTRWPVPLPGLIHRCYHQSVTHTGGVALMTTAHQLIGTWKRKVSLYITVSEFEKAKFVENGFPASRIFVKPNFVPEPGTPVYGGNGFLFVGRLAVEKGVATLLKAMTLTALPFRLTIVGEGALSADVKAAATRDSRIQYLGRLPQMDVRELMRQASCLVFPSEWYETFGRVAAEAFACGTPAIAANIGAVAEVVEAGVSGFHFRAGDAEDLARLMNHVHIKPEAAAALGKTARAEFEQRYTAERNYDMLIEAYQTAIERP